MGVVVEATLLIVMVPQVIVKQLQIKFAQHPIVVMMLYADRQIR